jgi:hypothetical protein
MIVGEGYLTSSTISDEPRCLITCWWSGRSSGRTRRDRARDLPRRARRAHNHPHVDPIETHPNGSDSHDDSRKMLSDERVGADIDAKILVVHDSSAARGLHPLAARRRYDLLVVGSCHRGAVGRQLAGNHTVESLHGAPCAGSPESMQALEAARAIVARTGATIEPLRVLPVRSIPHGQPIEHRWSEVAERLTPEDLARFGGADDPEVHVRYGSRSRLALICLAAF